MLPRQAQVLARIAYMETFGSESRPWRRWPRNASHMHKLMIVSMGSLNCCSPEAKTSGYGWSIFNAIFGWSNNASIGTILSYVFYWLSVIAALVYMKWSEGRVSLIGHHSQAGKRRLERRERAPAVNRVSEITAAEEEVPKGSPDLSVGKQLSSDEGQLHVSEREIDVDESESRRPRVA